MGSVSCFIELVFSRTHFNGLGHSSYSGLVSQRSEVSRFASQFCASCLRDNLRIGNMSFGWKEGGTPVFEKLVAEGSQERGGDCMIILFGLSSTVPLIHV